MEIKIKLIRFRHTPWATDGQLWLDGIRLCDTTENLQHHLPVGTYPVKLMRDKTTHGQGQLTPFVLSTEPRKRKPLAAITCGNGTHKLKGTILVGRQPFSGLCLHSRSTLQTLVQEMQTLLQVRHDVHFMLEIIDKPLQI